MELAEKEARETQYWLWLLIGSNIIPEGRLSDLYDECSQIVAIVTTIGKRARGIRGMVNTLVCLLFGL